ncbi:hypothetical protein HO173_006648 [Letharia columbiana]|uniref:Uncharacterized protein n=1 Tax=Letharia columbiana TaxID=112416 RepID=A0A8H6FUQ4_9LECA|nr:uncharacterized protein HO173_006648 [Letharia columbiana]KAF6235021.1 hypothetical protein HO173_006648 [Letharia columbiana]
MAFNTFDSYHLPHLRIDKDGMDVLDGKSMGDTGQIYSEAPRPGCQKVLEVNACVGFSSILPKDYGKKTGQETGEELGESCWHAGKIWLHLQDLSGRHGTVKTIRCLPLHLGKSSPVEAYTDYGCLETQGKQWACISGLPAMGAMAI